MRLVLWDGMRNYGKELFDGSSHLGFTSRLALEESEKWAGLTLKPSYEIATPLLHGIREIYLYILDDIPYIARSGFPFTVGFARDNALLKFVRAQGFIIGPSGLWLLAGVTGMLGMQATFILVSIIVRKYLLTMDDVGNTSNST